MNLDNVRIILSYCKLDVKFFQISKLLERIYIQVVYNEEMCRLASYENSLEMIYELRSKGIKLENKSQLKICEIKYDFTDISTDLIEISNKLIYDNYFLCKTICDLLLRFKTIENKLVKVSLYEYKYKHYILYYSFPLQVFIRDICLMDKRQNNILSIKVEKMLNMKYFIMESIFAKIFIGKKKLTNYLNHCSNKNIRLMIC